MGHFHLLFAKGFPPHFDKIPPKAVLLVGTLKELYQIAQEARDARGFVASIDGEPLLFQVPTLF